MPKYTEREALEVTLNHRLNFLMAENGEYDHYTSGFDEAVTRVEDFPAADVAPVRHGHWIWHSEERGFLCSECGSGCLLNYESDWHKSDWCPHCGAKMDLEG